MRIKQRIECTCKNCKKVFFIGLNKFNAGKGKYCSKQCYTNYTNKNTVKNILNSSCKNCGQRYHIEPKQIKKYCSKKCAVISSRRRIKKK